MLVPSPIRATPNPLLSVRGLAVAYDGVVAGLRDVTFDVDQGTILAILGANGAGKTTLLRAISGLLHLRRGTVTRGTVEFDGKGIDHLEPEAIARLGIAHAMEGGRAFPRLTVRENLDAGALSRPRREVAAARERVLGLFPFLSERLAVPAGSLSGGQQQLLAVARALMSEPRLLLLDEPNRGLAADMQDALRHAIVDAHTRGTTVILVEQRAANALELAHHAMVLHDGAVQLSGLAADLLEHADVLRSYVGEPPSGLPPSAEKPPAVHLAAPAAPVVLEVTDLTLRFGTVAALDGVSFSVGRDEVVAIIGANGAGKTSLLNCLNHAYVPTSGSIRVNGCDLTPATPARLAVLGVARAFQAPTPSPSLTVLDTVLLGRHRLMRAGTVAAALRTRRARAEEAAHRDRARGIAVGLGLERWLDRTVGSLPFGVQKRAELARAIAMEPALLLMDEPASGLSAAEVDGMAAALAAARADARQGSGLSMLIVEHDRRLVGTIADRVLVMEAGRVVSTGPPSLWPDPAAARAHLGG